MDVVLALVGLWLLLSILLAPMVGRMFGGSWEDPPVEDVSGWDWPARDDERPAA